MHINAASLDPPLSMPGPQWHLDWASRSFCTISAMGWAVLAALAVAARMVTKSKGDYCKKMCVLDTRQRRRTDINKFGALVCTHLKLCRFVEDGHRHGKEASAYIRSLLSEDLSTPAPSQVLCNAFAPRHTRCSNVHCRTPLRLTEILT